MGNTTDTLQWIAFAQSNPKEDNMIDVLFEDGTIAYNRAATKEMIEANRLTKKMWSYYSGTTLYEKESF